MGTYLNPGNEGFRVIRNGRYIDKSGLIRLVNNTINTKQKLTCVSRPRRFGKSFAAQMLCAYYDRSCDSSALFKDLEIAVDPDYETHRNQYNVIYLDMTGILLAAKEENKELTSFIIQVLSRELHESWTELEISADLSDMLARATVSDGIKFIMIIDEWDAPIRETPEQQSRYLKLLRMLFKNSGTTDKIFAAAYMTGILPIKKDGSQSAISDFREYTSIKPRKFGEYVGFTEKEVQDLCRKHQISFESMKQWYDGYAFKDIGSVYNPNSVMQAIDNEDFESYWTETSAAESLMEYISKGYHGLTKTIAELIGGVEVKVDTQGFANDMMTFRGKDDVLTLLIHLGYLAYNSETGTIRIPNEEIKREFQKSVRQVDHRETLIRLEESDQLFLDTILGNEKAVAAQIEKIHAEETSPLHYNREDSLRGVIKLAYYTYRDHYLQWEELPAGVGYADLVYLPKQDSGWPALVIELKWNQSAEGAIKQILKKNYPDALKGYGKEIVLVGVNYDKDAEPGERKHTCRILRITDGAE